MTIKSCPLDPIPASVLKQCTSVLLPVMTQIVNQSLNLAVFPDCFKLALLNPLLKKPALDVEALSNFRPISNLMFMSKLIEKVVVSQLINHISSNVLDEILQSAYKQFHSTKTALVKVFHDIVLDVDRNRTVILLLLDLSAAFDKVDRTILIERLANRFGLCDLALAWFKSYLSDKTHFVSIRGARSVTRPLSCHRVPCSDRFYICSIPPHWGILSGSTTWAIISMLMTLSCICLSILSVGMIKLILSLRLNPVLEISTAGCLVTNLS